MRKRGAVPMLFKSDGEKKTSPASKKNCMRVSQKSPDECISSFTVSVYLINLSFKPVLVLGAIPIRPELNLPSLPPSLPRTHLITTTTTRIQTKLNPAWVIAQVSVGYRHQLR